MIPILQQRCRMYYICIGSLVIETNGVYLLEIIAAHYA